MAFAAGQYPPISDVAGTVSPSSIPAGGCAVFSGTGFNPGVPIAVTDNGKAAGSATTKSDGTFAKTLCYSRGGLGKHTLTGTGDAPDSAKPQAAGLFRAAPAEAAVLRRVTAVLYVSGVTQTAPSATLAPVADGQGSGGVHLSEGSAATLAFTGFDAVAFATAGVTLVAVGSVFLIVTERKHRRRRRLA